MGMLRMLSKLAALRPKDIALLCRAAAAVTAARVGLSVLSFEDVRRLATTWPRVSGARDADSDKIAWAVGAVSRRIPGTHCLPQALAALALLRREGIDAELCVGIARVGDREVIGHAWVEHAGRVVIGETDRDYSPFPLPADAKREPQ